MKYVSKKLLGHEIFKSMVSWATIYFFKKFVSPPSYILNVRSLNTSVVLIWKSANWFTEQMHWLNFVWGQIDI